MGERRDDASEVQKPSRARTPRTHPHASLPTAVWPAVTPECTRAATSRSHPRPDGSTRSDRDGVVRACGGRLVILRGAVAGLRVERAAAELLVDPPVGGLEGDRRGQEVV